LIELFLWKDAAQILVVLHRLRLCQQVSTDRLCHQENSKQRIPSLDAILRKTVNGTIRSFGRKGHPCKWPSLWACERTL